MVPSTTPALSVGLLPAAPVAKQAEAVGQATPKSGAHGTTLGGLHVIPVFWVTRLPPLPAQFCLTGTLATVMQLVLVVQAMALSAVTVDMV